VEAFLTSNPVAILANNDAALYKTDCIEFILGARRFSAEGRKAEGSGIRGTPPAS
jgi:hypothetical protein